MGKMRFLMSSGRNEAPRMQMTMTQAAPGNRKGARGTMESLARKTYSVARDGNAAAVQQVGSSGSGI